MVGGYISHYLLEKSRICGQGPDERNYHIFYQLVAGCDSELWKELGLGPPDQFHYLSRGCTQFFGSKSSSAVPNERKSDQMKQLGPIADPIVDDVKDFRATDSALARFGVNDTDRIAMYKIVAAVLHLGNIQFEDNPDDNRGGCRVRVDGPARTALDRAAALLGLDPDELRQCMLSRVMQTSKGGLKGTVYLVPLKVYEACNARDALAKAIYSKLFDHLVTKVSVGYSFLLTIVNQLLKLVTNGWLALIKFDN